MGRASRSNIHDSTVLLRAAELQEVSAANPYVRP